MTLHKEEEKLLRKLREKLGEDAIRSVRVDQLDNSTVEDAGVVIMTMDAGDLRQAADMAGAANELVVRNPEIKFLFGINGCVDDPREIDQIPASRATLRKLFLLLRPEAFWRFALEQQALMLVAIGAGHRDADQLHVPPLMVRAP